MSPQSSAQDRTEQVVHATRNTNVAVPLYKSRVVVLPGPVKRVSIGNPDIADVLILGNDALYVLGKDLGTTNVLLWDREDQLVSALNITVTHDLDGLRRQIADRAAVGKDRARQRAAEHRAVGPGLERGEDGRGPAAGQGLSRADGDGQGQDHVQAAAGGGEQIDKKAGEVINLMTVGGVQQVMLQVRVAEVRRDAVRNLNAQMNAISNTGKWVAGGVNGGATFPDAIFQPGNVRIPIFGNGTNAGGNPIGPVFDEFAPNTPSISSTGLFGSFLSNDFLANVVLDAFQQRGLAKILAEPTLTTLTGQDAQFLSGGSFPIPVSQDSGTISIEFKDFGVKLLFVPLVLDDGRINLKLNVSVSELVDSNSLVLTPIDTTSRFRDSFAQRASRGVDGRAVRRPEPSASPAWSTKACAAP